ncbi:hypothetical protein [Streptomyces sp. PBH53]|uniref:hypothetical protein n=1 Tax=Streptomyces sp. PBH53 TaxID=1577075 RepID=UPI003965CA18
MTIWDGNLRQRLGVLAGADTGGRRGYRESVTSLAFSPDSRLLAVGGDYGTIQMRDTASSRAVGSALPTPGDLVLAPSERTATRSASQAPMSSRGNTSSTGPTSSNRRARGRGGLSAASWETYLSDVPYRETC